MKNAQKIEFLFNCYYYIYTYIYTYIKTKHINIFYLGKNGFIT